MNRDLMTGLKKSIPVVLGYTPIGLALEYWQPAGFNNLRNIFDVVFSICRPSQFIASAMITSGVNPASIIMTTLLINMRHMLMSALFRLSEACALILQAVLSFGLTDETYAVDITYCREDKPSASFL